MEEKNRNVWIIVIVAVAVLLLCCLIFAGIAFAVLGASSFALFRGGGVGQVSETIEAEYGVDPGSLLVVNNFAGDIVVRAGESGQVRVTVTKRAGTGAELNRIGVDISEVDGGVEIVSSHAGGIGGNRSVRIEVSVPPDASLDLRTDAGNIEVDGVEGDILASTGAGNVDVRGAVAPVALDTGAGEIDYTGDPVDLCTFDTEAGNIVLRLPADLDAEVVLTTGIGNVDVDDVEVEGDTGGADVSGVIGTGEQATIEANTGVGNITLLQR